MGSLPFPVSCNTVLGHTRHNLSPCLVLCCICLLYIYCFFPLFSPIDPEADATLVIDYVVDEPSLSAKQPGKQTSLMHAYITYSISLMLALEFATVIALSYSDA